MFLFLGIFALEVSFDYATEFTCINCVRTQIFARTNFIPFQEYLQFFVPVILALLAAGAFLGAGKRALTGLATVSFLFESWEIFYSQFSPIWTAATDPSSILFHSLQNRAAYYQSNSAGNVQAFCSFILGLLFLLVYLSLDRREILFPVLVTLMVAFTSLLIFELGIFLIVKVAWNAQVTLFQERVLPNLFSRLTNEVVFDISAIGVLFCVTFLKLRRYLV